jgi:SAM-dependent MidA family methyltransferase
VTPLETHLIAQIQRSGPLRLDAFMAMCLGDPVLGYYAARNPFGTAGDFVTSPEISQMFGELLGLCVAQAWVDQGSPTPFALAELGPGRGTLMVDALRATRSVAGFYAGMQVHLVETSTRLQDEQRVALAGTKVIWHDTVQDLPQMPLFLLANEFLDALPVRQFRRDANSWSERVVGVDQVALALGWAPGTDHPGMQFGNDTPGTIVEVCPDLPKIVGQVTARIATHGGVAIFVDYGGWRSKGDTVQAVRNHVPEGLLEHPGQADLTAHVDFEAVALAATECRVTGLTDQGALLARLGIGARAAILARGLVDNKLEQHAAATRRLTHPAEMGNLFKALAIYPNGSVPPPGFD